MSSNRATLFPGTLLALCLAAAVAGCASTGDGKLAKKDPPPLTPTEQFAITVTPHEDQVLLAPHAQGLSPAQGQALSELVDRWRETGDGVIRVQTPTRGGEEAYRASAVIEDALMGMGLRPDQVRLVDYDPGPRPNPPVVVGFTRYEALGPECGRHISSFTRSTDNKVNSNFGCATTANIAAMIANPADLMAPRAEGAPDGGRRETVIGKYRAGAITSSVKDSQASGLVSSVGGQ